MKTRAQIYSHETSGILWDIFTYGVLHKNRFWVYIHRRMSNALCAMNTMDLQRYPENYELLSTDAALRAEQIACRMRHLVYGFTTVQKHEDLTSAANVLGITITAHPCLLYTSKCLRADTDKKAPYSGTGTRHRIFDFSGTCAKI